MIARARRLFTPIYRSATPHFTTRLAADFAAACHYDAMKSVADEAAGSCVRWLHISLYFMLIYVVARRAARALEASLFRGEMRHAKRFLGNLS